MALTRDKRFNHGLTTVDKLYTTRNLRAYALLWDCASGQPEEEVRNKLIFTLTSLYQRITKLSEFRFWGGSGNIANYNVPMIMNEQNVFKAFRRKAKTIADHMATFSAAPDGRSFLAVSSATDLSFLPDESIDFVFTDPPFGGNINYSEMNFIWESWLQQFTQIEPEAIINKIQGKGLEQYQALMTLALSEAFRVLKEGHWMCLMFHNSSAAVWQAIQNAITGTGFAIRGTQTFDKEHGTFKQFVSGNAVGYDLVIHCLKDGSDRANARGVSLFDQQSVEGFLVKMGKQQVRQNRKQFLHVAREEELDYRRLYSKWLKHTIREGGLVRCDFDRFRDLVDRFLNRHSG